LNNRLIPRWGDQIATDILPIDVERWLEWLADNESLQNPTLDKYRRVMALVYKHAQRHQLISRTQDSNPMKFVRQSCQGMYEAIVLTAEETLRILQEIKEQDVRTLVLLIAGTGLRISEALALRWNDIDWAASKIAIRRAWTQGQFGDPKTMASKAAVPMGPLLAAVLNAWRAQTAYSKTADFVFASERMKGKQPRTANVMTEDHLRPAAARAGILKSRLQNGKLVECDPRRFGFHNLRHSLASLLVNGGEDPKTAQALLRHANVSTTLQMYVHPDPEKTLAAQERILLQIFPRGKRGGSRFTGLFGSADDRKMLAQPHK
jgi:integrase